MLDTKGLGKQLVKESRKPAKTKQAANAQHIMSEWGKHLGGEKELAKEEENANKLNKEELLEKWLETRVGFACEYIPLRGQSLYNLLDDYQIKILDDDNRYIFVKKSRRTGLSWTSALKGLVKSHLEDSMDSYYVSVEKREAEEKIKYAVEMYWTMPAHVRKDLVTKSKTPKTQLEFAPRTGHGSLSRLISHPQTEPRGREGDIYLDEFAKYYKQNDIYVAATHCILRRGSITVISTPRNKGDLFWAIDTNNKNEYSVFNGHRMDIPWWHCTEMVQPGMLEEAKRNAPRMSTKERVMKYGSDRLIDVYNSGAESDFKVEEECQYQDDADSPFNDATINPCYFRMDSEELSDMDLGHQSLVMLPMEEKLKTAGIPPRFYESFDHFIVAVGSGIVTRRLHVGIDPGHTDGCAITVVEERDKLAILRFQVKITEGDYKEIEGRLVHLCASINPATIAIDIRDGQGRALSSAMKGHPGIGEYRIKELATDSRQNNDMFLDIIRRFQSTQLAIPHHADLIRDLRKVRRIYTASGIPTIEIKRDSKHGHGDRYVSLVYALSGLAPLTEYVQPMSIPTYDDVPKRQIPQIRNVVDIDEGIFKKAASSKIHGLSMDEFSINKVKDLDIFKLPKP